MLIRGDKLNSEEKRLVLAAFVHRWTHENATQTYGGRCPGCVQSTRAGLIVTGVQNPRGPGEAPLKIWTEEEWHAYHLPLKSDAEWLAEYAFHFVKDGSRLSAKHHSAVPVFLADTEAEDEA